MLLSNRNKERNTGHQNAMINFNLIDMFILSRTFQETALTKLATALILPSTKKRNQKLSGWVAMKFENITHGISAPDTTKEENIINVHKPNSSNLLFDGSLDRQAVASSMLSARPTEESPPIFNTPKSDSFSTREFSSVSFVEEVVSNVLRCLSMPDLYPFASVR